MDNYINRNDLLKKLDDLKPEGFKTSVAGMVAINTINAMPSVDICDKYRWHKYPDEKPTENKNYLVVQKVDAITVRYYYRIFGFADNLKAFSDDFWGVYDYRNGFENREYYNHCGFYDYDGDMFHYECAGVVAWMEIPEYEPEKESKLEK